jgi:hypothetical protein
MIHFLVVLVAICYVHVQCARLSLVLLSLLFAKFGLVTDFTKLFNICSCLLGTPVDLARSVQSCGSGMFIPDPGSEFFHPGTQIRIKEFKYIINHKKWFLGFWKYDSGCSSGS